MWSIWLQLWLQCCCRDFLSFYIVVALAVCSFRPQFRTMFSTSYCMTVLLSPYDEFAASDYQIEMQIPWLLIKHNLKFKPYEFYLPF